MTFFTFFRSVKRGLVIGGSTAGANGAVTGVELPGVYTMSFSVMDVGHQPDIFVEPTIADLAAGRDTVLLRGIEELLER